jgi:soluble lytic murein transglycosylase-like protein
VDKINFRISLRKLIRNPLIFATVCMVACVTTSRPGGIALDTSATPETSKLYRTQFESLQKSIAKDGVDSRLLADVNSILLARSLEEESRDVEALTAWKTAIGIARGPFGEIAFNGWLRSFIAVKDLKGDADFIATEVLKETAQGNTVPWLVEKDLTAQAAMSAFIAVSIPDRLEKNLEESGARLSPPSRLGIQAGDPTMIRLAREACKHRSRFGDGWVEWKMTLAKNVADYFDALVMQCSGAASKAAQQFLEVAASLAADQSTAHLALEAYSLGIKIKRDAGERESVAPLYLPLMRLWKNDVISEFSLGISRQQFDNRRIEDALAASRYQGLIASYDVAIEYSNLAIQFAQMARSQSWSYNAPSRTELAGQIAEAYHIQAFRVAYEKKDLKTAIAVTQKALKEEGLNKEWSQRLNWSLGLYEYLSANFNSAQKIWEQMLSDNSDDSYRPMLLYWISRCHGQNKAKGEEQFYQKMLLKEFPLSFYSIVALNEGVEENANARDWHRSFGTPRGLNSRLGDWDDESFESIRRSSEMGRLLRRAELLVSAGVDKFSSLAIDELQRSLNFEAGDENSVAFQVYVTRLYAAARHWLSSISMTTKILRGETFWDTYPEQLLVYFPTPWLNLFEKISNEFSLSSELVMAVARQETAFKFDAKSPANAYGLMQLTMPTAKTVASSAGVVLSGRVDQLYEPETNLRLGSAYLKALLARYGGDQWLVYAAYNAGEAAADSWKDRRRSEDPILSVELIPYTETKAYVKNVWRNREVYAYLKSKSDPLSPRDRTR